MRYLRVTARIDTERAPPLFDRLANTSAIEQARVLDWNLTAEDAMLLFAVDGDPTPLSDSAAEFDGIDRVEVAGDGQRGDENGVRMLAHVQRSAVPIFSCLASALEAGGLIVQTPVVFADGEVHARIVGDPGPLQTAFERQGDGIDVRIDEISATPAVNGASNGGLSERQREAIVAAKELGYYEKPRGATQADVAAALECSPQTAGDHLRKAQAKLVDAALDEVESSV